MELYSGAKMLNEKDLKTKYLRSKNREFTVYHSLTYTYTTITLLEHAKQQVTNAGMKPVQVMSDCERLNIQRERI
jgi:hypothetical protein